MEIAKRQFDRRSNLPGRDRRVVRAVRKMNSGEFGGLPDRKKELIAGACAPFRSRIENPGHAA